MTVHLVDDIDAADLAAIEANGLTVGQAVALVAEVEWSDEILTEIAERGDEA